MAVRSRIVRLAVPTVFIAVAVACRDDPSEPIIAASIQLQVVPPGESPVGEVVAPTPTFIVRDRDGNALGGLSVQVDVVEGGGIIAGAPRRTVAGETSIGTWTLGPRPGRNVLSVRIGRQHELEIAINAVAGVPVSITVAQGNDQTALAGAEVALPLVALVSDRLGNGVAAVDVTFAVEAGQGTLSTTTVTTDASGRAGDVRWRLGNRGGEQRVVATAGTFSTTFRASPRTDFAFDLRFHGTAPEASIQALFRSAAERVRAAVVGDLPDVLLQGFDATRCGVAAPPLTETVDDVIVFATVTPIDGPGKILGSAGACLVRTLSGYPVIGLMRFDTDDIDALASGGRLEAVMLHEMLHIVGVGTLWRSKDLIVGSGTQDPRFAGALGAVRCLSAGGDIACADSRVPIENTGGSGTIEAHWRESVFDSELMTGFAEASAAMPFSAITIASLEDLGIVPNYLAADPYFLPPAALQLSPRLSPPATVSPPWEELERPKFDVTPGGWVRPVAWQ